jgi:hypothetical protein
MSEEVAKCELCGEPMPEGETMFKFHGYSGPCPKPPLPRESARQRLIRAYNQKDDVLFDATLNEVFGTDRR